MNKILIIAALVTLSLSSNAKANEIDIKKTLPFHMTTEILDGELDSIEHFSVTEHYKVALAIYTTDKNLRGRQYVSSVEKTELAEGGNKLTARIKKHCGTFDSIEVFTSSGISIQRIIQ